MAVDIPILLGGGGFAAPTDSTDVSTPLEITLSRAIAANTLTLVGVSVLSRNTLDVPTVSGGGVTWVQETDADNPYRDLGGTLVGGLYLFRAVGGSPSGTTVTISPTAAWSAVVADVIEWPDASIAGTAGADALVQIGLGGGSSVNEVFAGMDTIASADNAFFVFGGHIRSSTPRNATLDEVLSELSNDFARTEDDTGRAVSGLSGYALGLQTADPSLGFTLSGGTDGAGVIAVEIAAAGGPAPTTVSIDQSDPQQVEVGGTLQLSATVTNGDGATTWASDDEAVATVNASGLVSGVSIGSAEITATNNGVSDSITVNVEAAPAQAPTVTITSPAGNIAVTEGTTIVATATATDPVDGDLSASVEWTSSVDGALGTGAKIEVDTDGWSAGNRTITATATNAAELDGSDDFVLTIGEAPEPPEPEARFDAARFAINAAGGIA